MKVLSLATLLGLLSPNTPDTEEQMSALATRKFTVHNKCSFTIWPALFTDPSSPSKPDHATGWKQDPGSTVTFNVPGNWKSGRIWGRRDCDFRKKLPGPNQCLSGGCNGGLQCDKQSGTGVPPVSLAEWTLQGANNLDNYDVSLVDGFNLPMRITNNKGCPDAGCAATLNGKCPKPLQGPFDNKGNVIGCKSACIANLDGHPQDSNNCCSGSHNTPQTCPKSKVQFYDFFKNACPNAYAYAYDDKTALKTCPSGKNADYTLTFCP